jgi:hypothetical protein
MPSWVNIPSRSGVPRSSATRPSAIRRMAIASLSKCCPVGAGSPR